MCVCVCVWGEMYLLLVRGVSRSKTLDPLILSQSGWIAFITIITNSKNTLCTIMKFMKIPIRLIKLIDCSEGLG